MGDAKAVRTIRAIANWQRRGPSSRTPAAAIQFAVPAQPSPAASHVSSQAFSIAAAANPFGVILSNGVVLTIEAL